MDKINFAMRFCQGILRTLVLLSLVTPMSCEIDTTAHIDGKMPPTISLYGNGHVNFIRVMSEPVKDHFWQESEGGLWQIAPNDEFKDKTISDYPPIKFGVVPPGFVQQVPRDGSPPTPLDEGKTYMVWAPTYNANGGGISFTVKDGKSIELH